MWDYFFALDLSRRGQDIASAYKLSFSWRFFIEDTREQNGAWFKMDKQQWASLDHEAHCLYPTIIYIDEIDY